MGVGIGGLPAFAAHQLIDRHARLAALDIPERLVDAADGAVQHRPVLPVRAVVAGLPDIFDAIRGLASRNGFRYFSRPGFTRSARLRESGAAVAVEAILVGGDLTTVSRTPAGWDSITPMSLMRGAGRARVARATASCACCSRG